MRLFVFLLIFANLLFFAYAEGYLGGESVSEPGRLAEQIQPDRLHLMWRPGEAPSEADKVVPSEGEGVAVATEGEPEGAQTEVLPPDSPADPAPAVEMVCVLMGGLTTQAADELEKKAEAMKLDARRRSEGNWWVAIPPLRDKEAADKKAGELLRLGVTEFFIVAEGPQKFAISLGVFSQEEGARRHLTALRGKGVRSARVEARQPEYIRATMEVHGTAQEIAALREQLPAETSSVRACP